MPVRREEHQSALESANPSPISKKWIVGLGVDEAAAEALEVADDLVGPDDVNGVCVIDKLGVQRVGIIHDKERKVTEEPPAHLADESPKGVSQPSRTPLHELLHAIRIPVREVPRWPEKDESPPRPNHPEQLVERSSGVGAVLEDIGSDERIECTVTNRESISIAAHAIGPLTDKAPERGR
jgi:hypothetical protein